MDRPRARFGLLLCLCALLAWLGPEVAVCAQERDALARRRLIYRFDFDERDRGNFEDLPMHWFPIGRPAQGVDINFNRTPVHSELMQRASFPVHGQVRFDKRQAYSGNYSFYLGMQADNVGAFLEIGTLPTVPQSDYLVTVWVRTHDLKHAGAHLTAYFIDAQGRRIDASMTRAGPVRSSEQWQQISVRLMGDHPNAVWVGMELGVQQPDRAGTPLLGKHQILYQDVTGGAWFDDLTLWQLPRVTVETQNPVNIIRKPEKPRLLMSVRDLTGQPLQAYATVYDHNLKPVAQTHQPVGGGAPTSVRWSPDLPRLGWYLVDLVVRDPSLSQAQSAALPIARTLGAFLWLAEDSPVEAAEAHRFTIDAQNIPDDQFDLVPMLMDQAGIESTIISCWSRGTTKATLDERAAKLEYLVAQLQSRGRRVTVSLDPLPDELAQLADIDIHSPTVLFTPGSNAWMPYLGPVLMRQGQRARRWQLGSTMYAGHLASPDLPGLLTRVRREFNDLMPQPTIVLPWRLDIARPAGLDDVDQVALDVPPGIVADNIPEHAQEWRKPASSGATIPFTLHMRVPPATVLSQQRRIDDMAIRLLHAWEAGASGVAITKPWTYASDRKTILLPDPTLGVFSAMSRRLAGRKFVGYMPMVGGSECMIFSGASGGMLAVWNRWAPDPDSTVHMYLGANPRAIDVFGNRSEIPLVNGRHRLQLAPTPLFIEGIDPALAQFRAAFKIEPAFLESLQTPHERHVTLFNPWSRTISGTIYVVEPADWNIQPRRTQFSIAAGQTSVIPMTIMFPVSEIAGKKRMIFRLDFQAEQRYTIDIPTDLTLGLRDVDFDAQITLETDPKTQTSDVVVTQLISNTGSKPMSVYAFASMAGFPRQERVVAGLMPGQSTYRRFRFVGAGEKARETPIRVGLRETAGPAVLNKVLSIEQR